jgi:hypothetical protein
MLTYIKNTRDFCNSIKYQILFDDYSIIMLTALEGNSLQPSLIHTLITHITTMPILLLPPDPSTVLPTSFSGHLRSCWMSLLEDALQI